MKTRLLLAALLLLSSLNSYSQTVIWNETFDPSPGWISVPIGVNGADPNFFEEDDDEGGVLPPGCGVAGNLNNTLHITSVFFPAGGAAYDAGGLCGFLFCPETATRAQSPNISTIGQTNLTLEFDYIHGGDANDFGGVWYNDGFGWVALVNPLPQTPLGCLPQGQWTNFTIALPASCENIANLQIGFSWVNNDDGAGADPSIAINNVQITVPTIAGPTADFAANLTNICEGDCIDFTDMSTLSTNPTWSWTFTGAATATSAIQNPTNICYPTAGVYQVALTVTDDNGTDTETKVGYITVVAAPEAGLNAAQNLCNNATLNLNTINVGADPGGTWLETSGTPSGQFTAGTGVLDGNGLTPGNVYTFTYTVTGTAPCPNDMVTMTITIIDCSGGAPPVADFSANLTALCEGDCIDFTDMSTIATNPTWAWTFTGASTASSAVQNPTGICYPTAGTYQVALTVTDDNGNDTETKVGYIVVSAPPNAGANPNVNACNDATIDLDGELVGADPGGVWAETSGTPSGQFTPGTGVLDGNGLPLGNVYTFTYTVTGTAPCLPDVATVTVTIVDCSVLTPGFTPSDLVICESDCITFNDNSTGPITTWNWVFNGGTPGTFSGQNPGSVCFAAAGTYDVDLTIGDGTSTMTSTVQITVNPTPVVTATATPNDTICNGDQVTLTGGGASTYVWDNGVTNATAFTPASTTTYTVTGTDVNGCERSTPITITVVNCDSVSAEFSVANTNICYGDCITFTDLSTGNIASWSWDFDGAGTPATSTLPSPTICFDTTGTFDIELTVVGGANTSVFTITINVYAGPLVTATLDTLIDLGGQADLIAVGSGPGSYSWDPPEFVDCESCAVTWANPYLSTIYIVTHTDINGCSAQDTVIVDVNFIVAIDVPSAFSPNGDGNNDVLYVKGFGIANMIFAVYNRYGEKVFEVDDQSIGWDGTFRGRNENSGVFTWVLDYTMVNGDKGILKGNTTLIR